MEKEIKNVKENEGNEEKQELVVSGFGSLANSSKTRKRTYTTIDLADVKTLYNLDNKDCDFRINDCVGQSIRVTDVVIKEFERDLEEPILDKDSGEVVQDKERKLVTILIDEQNQTYVTASKVFTLQMKRFIETFGIQAIKNGLEIKIVNKKIQNSNNKALGFELI